MSNNEKLCVNAAGEKRGSRSLIMGSVCDTGQSRQNSGFDPRWSGCSLAQGPEIRLYVLKQRELTTEGVETISQAAKGICEHLVLGPLCLDGNSRRRTPWEKPIMTSALLVVHQCFLGRRLVSPTCCC